MNIPLPYAIASIIIFIIAVNIAIFGAIAQGGIFCIKTNNPSVEPQDRSNCFWSLEEHKSHFEYLKLKYPTQMEHNFIKDSFNMSIGDFE